MKICLLLLQMPGFCHLKIPFKDSAFDVVILISVLEHCYEDFDAIVRESRRVVSEKGIVVGFVPFFLGYHDSDYWRFTYEGVEMLLNGFRKIRIIPIGGPVSVSLQIMVDLVKPYQLRNLLARVLSPLCIKIDRVLWSVFCRKNKKMNYISRGYLFICEN